MRPPINMVAKELKCSVEEAQLLLQNAKGYKRPSLLRRALIRSERVAQNNRAIGWTLGGLIGLIRFTIWNSRAALFFGTLGYWAFGAMSAAWLGNYGSASLPLTGIHPLDMVIGNPLVMFALSTALMLIGMRGDENEVSLFNGLHMMVVMPSIVLAYLGSIVMGIMFMIALLFGADKTGGGGTIMMMLFLFLIPAGYLAVFKLQDEM